MPDTRLRMAVPKGALFADTVGTLRRAGVDVGCLADPGRQLIVDTGEMRFIICKPTDIPAYVAYGAADVGVSGADVLAEAALDVAELVDLGYGACRFVVAEREGSTEAVEQAYRRLGVIRIATKYPRVAEAHFASRGIQVELVKLHGNIELAPLVGLADRVVDITATGTTLRENGLRIVEEVMVSSARFVANPVAMRIDAQRVTDLACRLQDAAAQAED